MIKQFWLNLPVRNIKTSKIFYTKMGFKPNTKRNSVNSASFFIGDQHVVLMLIDEDTFKMYINNESDISWDKPQVLFSIDAQSKEEVDNMAQKAIAAGGSSNHNPTVMTSWLYGCNFSDPDGHRWNVLYIDLAHKNII